MPEDDSLPVEPERAPLRFRIKQWLRDLIRYSRPLEPPPPRGNHLDRAVYGAAQPLLGLRLVFSSWDILREAIEPALWMAAVCSLYAWAHVSGEEIPKNSSLWVERIKTFYLAFGYLAAAPSVIFANHYARFAAMIRYQLGFGACGPREMPLTTSIRRLIQQALVIAIGVAPFVFIVELVPGGKWIAQGLAALWALNWIVLDAFDDANVLQPGQTLAEVEKEADHLRRPWFVRFLRWLELKMPERPRLLRGLTRRFGNLLDRLSKPWREESALLEASPRLGVGFALSTAGLLAIPVVNLLFRPAIIAGATHLLGHIEKDEHAESPEILHEHAPPEHAGEKPAASIGARFPKLGDRF